MPVSYVVSESHWRSASKGISYRLFATLVTASMSFALTGSFKTAIIIGVAEVTGKVALYWAHERIWTRIKWGRLHKVIAGDQSQSQSAAPGHGADEPSPAQ